MVMRRLLSQRLSIPTTMDRVGRRHLAAAAYVEKAAGFQKDYAAKRDKDTLTAARKFFESETLEEVETIGDGAGPMMGAVATFRPSIMATKGIATLMDFLQKKESMDKVSTAAMSRVLHSAVVLHVPGVFDVLIQWLWKVVEEAPKLDATAIATCINAYGRSGIRHDILYEALTKRAKEVMANPAPPLSHIANVLHALSRVEYFDEELFQLLTKHAVARQVEATPLVIATVLDACAAVNFVPNSLFLPYEQTAASNVNECSPALMASLVLSLAKTDRAKSPVFPAVAERGAAITQQYDPASIGRTLHAFRLVDHRNEDFFGALSERACRVAPEFRLEEIAQILGSLAHFDLYDAELFPLLATRVVNITRGRSSFQFNHVAEVVRAFAKVHERNDDFLNALGPILLSNVGNLKDAAVVDLLYGYGTFGIKNDLVKELLKLRTQLTSATKKDRAEDLKFIDKQYA